MTSNANMMPAEQPADPIDDDNVIEAVAPEDDETSEADETDDLDDDTDEDDGEPDVDESDTGTDDVPE